uniref:Uncharacterized protein n=1 Tax=Sphaerodactylus townsendi TaxID=933632 RepID=A0ACB8FTD5_9SAUR
MQDKAASFNQEAAQKPEGSCPTLSSLGSAGPTHWLKQSLSRHRAEGGLSTSATFSVLKERNRGHLRRGGGQERPLPLLPPFWSSTMSHSQPVQPSAFKYSYR